MTACAGDLALFLVFLLVKGALADLALWAFAEVRGTVAQQRVLPAPNGDTLRSPLAHERRDDAGLLGKPSAPVILRAGRLL